RNRLSDQIKLNADKLANPSKYKLSQGDVERLQGEMNEDNNLLNRFDTRITNYDDLAQKFKEQKAEWKNRRDSTDAAITPIQNPLPIASSTLASLNRQLSETDEKIASLFGDNGASNQFKTTMSAVFAGLVALVIIGFFYIATKDESVRRAIF